MSGEPTQAFSFKSKGQLTTIGHQKAVVDIFGIRLSGFVAWMLWRGVYLLKFPTLSRKLRILFEWIWTCLFPPDIAHLSLSRTTLLRPATSQHAEVLDFKPRER